MVVWHTRLSRERPGPDSSTTGARDIRSSGAGRVEDGELLIAELQVEHRHELRQLLRGTGAGDRRDHRRLGRQPRQCHRSDRLPVIGRDAIEGPWSAIRALVPRLGPGELATLGFTRAARSILAGEESPGQGKEREARNPSRAANCCSAPS